MNAVLREELLVRAAKRAAEEPALVAPAVRAGIRRLRRRLLALSLLAIALAALPVVVVAARMDAEEPSPAPSELTTESLVVDPSDAVLTIGAARALSAHTRGDDGVQDVTARVRWASTDPEIVTVDRAGLATAVSAGTAHVTASLAGMRGAATIVVLEPDETVTSAAGDPPTPGPVTLTAVDVTPPAALLAPRDRMPLQATARYSDSSTADVTSQVSWESSDENVAAVDNTGAVVAVAEGEASITATLDGEEGLAQITVEDVVVRLVIRRESAASRTEQEIRLQIDQAVQLTAEAFYSDGSAREVTPESSWTSSDTSIAPVDGGLVVARSQGSVTISASLGDHRATATVTVSESPEPGDPEPVP